MAGTADSLPGFDDQAPADRFCDLVLTGGVTSAIAYPGVIHSLAQAYRFHAIGGSSSGAGSAALAAAAEYRRRHGSSEGFRTLLRRTAAVRDDYAGRTGLAWLFQPEARHARLFSALLPVFAGPKGRVGGLLGPLGPLARAYAGPLMLGLAAGAALPLAAGVSIGAGLWGWIFAACITAPLGALSFAADALRKDLETAANTDYGLCSGQQCEPGAPHPPLTAWLHELLQDIAGLPPAQPLTFADLHSAPGGPQALLGDRHPAGERAIELRMFASNVTLKRPLLLPQQDGDEPLCFRASEMLQLFPPEVVQHMQRHGGPADPHDADLFMLPQAQLPVVVAARMSVSFPVLFSAVPLWQRVGDGRGWRRLLIVDGALCSGFPIHFFDSPIPAWPTFGVALHEDGGGLNGPPKHHPAWAWVPQRHDEMPPDDEQRFEAQRFDTQRPGREDAPLRRLGGFAWAAFCTIRDWNDAELARLPGVRERVAHIALPEGVGGLNVLMSADEIRWLAMRGGDAGRLLLQRFSSPGPGGAQAQGWREHRWVRFNVLHECLHESLVGLSRAAQYATHARPLREQLRDALREPALQADDPRTLRPAEAAALERTLDALLQIERALTPPPMELPYQPQPRPQLRIRPPI